MAFLPPSFADRLFAKDRASREAFTLLAPDLHAKDLGVKDPAFFAPKIAELGRRLYTKGSLPDLPSWEFEESPEFLSSVELWEQAIEEEGSRPFNSLVQASFLQAEAAFGQMGRLASRVAALRWCSCMCWLAARASIADVSSAGGSFSSVDAILSHEACKESKSTIQDWLRGIVTAPAVMAIFDFDLVGHGVWHDRGREPLMWEAYNEWFRRGCEYDLVSFSVQVLEMPPDFLNASAPQLKMVQPLGTPDLHVPLSEVPRRILERHEWYTSVKPPPLDTLPVKAPITGPVLHMDIPPEPEFDFNNPEIIAKVQRGEPLGKGSQEDGLPGAVHGSASLLFAALAVVERIENVRIYEDLLEINDFLEYFLRYGPALRSLDLRGAVGRIDAQRLNVLHLAGPTVQSLDLSECGLGAGVAEDLLEAIVHLPGLKFLDLAQNQFSQDAAISLVGELAERRLDIQSVRLDGNPLEDLDAVRTAVAVHLAKRGATTVAGGDLVMHFGNSGVSWTAQTSNQPAERLRDGTDEPLKLTSLKELRQKVMREKWKADEFEEKDPFSRTEAGQRWLQEQRIVTESVLETQMMQIYRMELASRAKDSESKPGAASSAAPTSQPAS